MPNAQTLQVLADLKKAGLDTSTIETQLRVNPVLDKQADSIIGGGILRQNEYTRVMNLAQQKEQELENKIKQLATGHDALANLTEGSEAYKEMVEHVTLLENYLKETGEYTPESIEAVSFAGKQKLDALINKGTNPPPNPPNPTNNANKGADDMPNENKGLIDAETLQKSNMQLALGSTLLGIRVQQKLKEVADLGIKIDDALQEKFETSLISGLNAGKPVDKIFDETFNLSQIRNTQATEARTKELADERAAGRAEGLKEAGVPDRKLPRLTRHVILDSKSIQNATKTQESFRDDKGNLDPTKLPVNERGEVERYKIRGSKEARLERAATLQGQILDHYANDPTYVE